VSVIWSSAHPSAGLSFNSSAKVTWILTPIWKRGTLRLWEAKWPGLWFPTRWMEWFDSNCGSSESERSHFMVTWILLWNRGSKWDM
jgi:hypothetical protein